MSVNLHDLKVNIFADGAEIGEITKMNNNPLIKGLTTNPTLMRKAGVTSYRTFARDVLSFVTQKPISFEVFSDDLLEMESQAYEIASWADNVYVKIPITNTEGKSTKDLIKKLVSNNVKVNVTAIMTIDQVKEVSQSLNLEVPNYISIFAGRIADTGRDPVPIMKEALSILKPISSSQLIWASPRELLNIIQASEIGCHIITATTDILKKIDLIGYNLEDYSLDTVKMFYRDALESSFKIE